MAKDSGKRTARERIERLFVLADRDFSEFPERSHRNIMLARRIAMKHNIRLSPNKKRRFCSNCYKYLKPNVNCTVEKTGDTETTKCLCCGHTTKRPAGCRTPAKSKKEGKP